ncbi:MAG: right-handed parallel beta-helix repeat-containing protein, partial [Planctomycetaceae bacterium]|nr:right-handed parallel beta-helix repeat-containing protein [Planctomycetaceae bacterium]
NNTFNNNINPNTGLHVNSNGGTITFRSFNTITATGNTGIGIAFDATAGGTISAVTEDANGNGVIDPGEDMNGNGVLDLGLTTINASNNTTDGFVATADGAGSTINLSIGSVNATANLFNSNGQNGISLNTLNTGTIGGQIVNNTATGNGQDGFANTLTTGTIDLTTIASPSISNNTFTGNTRHGMSITNNNGGTFTTALISSNDFSNNTEAGLFIGGSAMGGANTAVNTLGSIDMNNFNRETLGTEGILFGSSDVRTTASITRNTFIGRAPNLPGDAGAGPGVGGTVTGTTTVGGNGGVTLAFGSLAAVDNSLINTFQNNGDAHIGLVMEGNTTNQVDIDQHNFNTTTDTTVNTDFSGQGVGFILRDTATYTGTIQRNTFQNNAASGLFFSVTGNNGVDFAQLNNVVVGGATGFGNTFTSNGGSGLESIRTANGVVNNFQVLFNTFNTNNLDGISLTAANANIVDTYTVNDNTITGNTQNGIDISVQADAGLQANMTRNTITGNGADGIRTTEMVNDPSDLRRVSGAWTANTITGNTGNGIELAAASNGLVIGDTVNSALGNVIQNNTLDGVAITGAGSVTVARNMIASNTVHGIDLDLPGGTVTISNNDITLNGGDGIEFTNSLSATSTLNITGNVIDFNNGRGFDVLARPGSLGASSTDITFNNNIVNANLEEGVYVVYTASNTQTQTGPSTDPLAADGNLFHDVFLRFNMDNNQILANGFNSGFSTTGLVVRVGTTNASTSTTFDGGFASDGVGNFTNSGVIMSVTNSTLTGNFGDDVFFQSFTSTVDPAATAGTWGATNDPTAITTFQSDALARLDLNWSTNTILSSDANNTGAFYNNADTFKSRLNNVASPGPFTSTSRRRNAQRQAARINNLIAPGAGTFLYSGTGASTFRVDSTGDLGIFILDGNPYTTTGDANGVFLPGSIVGELPFGWGQY